MTAESREGMSVPFTCPFVLLFFYCSASSIAAEFWRKTAGLWSEDLWSELYHCSYILVMTAKALHVEQEIVTAESAAPWGRALSTNRILDSEADPRDEQSDAAGQELIQVLFCCWMMRKKKEPLRLFAFAKTAGTGRGRKAVMHCEAAVMGCLGAQGFWTVFLTLHLGLFRRNAKPETLLVLISLLLYLQY